MTKQLTFKESLIKPKDSNNAECNGAIAYHRIQFDFYICHLQFGEHMSLAFANQIPWAYNQISPDDDDGGVGGDGDGDGDANKDDDNFLLSGDALSCLRRILCRGILVVSACIELQILGTVLNAAHANRILGATKKKKNREDNGENKTRGW